MNAKMVLTITMTVMMGIPALAASFTEDQAFKAASILRAQDDGSVTYRSTEVDDGNLRELHSSDTDFLVLGSSIVAVHKNAKWQQDEILDPSLVFIKDANGNTASLADIVK